MKAAAKKLIVLHDLLTVTGVGYSASQLSSKYDMARPSIYRLLAAICESPFFVIKKGNRGGTTFKAVMTLSDVPKGWEIHQASTTSYQGSDYT